MYIQYFWVLFGIFFSSKVVGMGIFPLTGNNGCQEVAIVDQVLFTRCEKELLFIILLDKAQVVLSMGFNK
jgi:hypothetical protein